MAFERKLRQGSEDFPELGAIFMSNRATKKICFSCETFGLPYSQSSFVKQVKAGMFLFLFEHETRTLYGVYQACTDGTVNFTSNPFSSSGRKYPAQVKFRVIWYCEPLSEDEFRPAIEDNYFTPYKFKFGLSRSQVWELLTLFSSRKIGDVSQQLDILPNPIVADAGELQNRLYIPNDEGYDPDDPLLNDMTATENAVDGRPHFKASNISINGELLNIKPQSASDTSSHSCDAAAANTQKQSVFSRLKPVLDADDDEGGLEDAHKSIDDMVNEVMETLKGHYCQLVSESNFAVDQVISDDDDDNNSEFKKSPSVEYEAVIESPRLSFKRRSEVHKSSSAAAGEKQGKRRKLVRPRSDNVDEERIDCGLKLSFTMFSGDEKAENTVCCDLNGEVPDNEHGVHEEEKSIDLLAEAIPASCQGTDVRYFEFLTK